MSAWVPAHLTDLRETALAQYVREAKTALDEAETAFRADFVGKLQENLHMLESQRKELNSNLRHRPFHGQSYSFPKKPDKELKPVLERLDASLPPGCTFLHWGDRDLGGLRICAKIEQANASHRLQPHPMNEASPNDSRFPSETRKKLQRHAAEFTAAGSLARSWCENPKLGFLEQELKDPIPPLVGGV